MLSSTLRVLVGLLFLGAAQPDSTPNVVPPPPREEPAEVRALIDDASKALAEDRKEAGEILADPGLLPAHEFTRFRELIRANAPVGAVTLSGPGEPGTRLVAKGRLIDAESRPISGALVYAYHTDARGWYSHRGPHVGGNSGDTKHARLFAYVRTDADGGFELRTIRPAGYPRSDLPQHVHIHFEAEGFRPLVSEILFEDDPRLTPAMRREAAGERALICPVEKLPDGSEQVRSEFTLGRR